MRPPGGSIGPEMSQLPIVSQQHPRVDVIHLKGGKNQCLLVNYLHLQRK